MISITITQDDDTILGPIMAEEAEVLDNAVLVKISNRQMKLFPFRHCLEVTVDYLTPPDPRGELE